VRFLVDTQLPAALARWLRERGHEADHVLEIGLARSKDAAVWRYAQEHRAVIITKDEDFAEWVRRGRPGPPVVWLRIGNSSKSVLLLWVEPLLPLILQKLAQNNRVSQMLCGANSARSASCCTMLSGRVITKSTRALRATHCAKPPLRSRFSMLFSSFCDN